MHWPLCTVAMGKFIGLSKTVKCLLLTDERALDAANFLAEATRLLSVVEGHARRTELADVRAVGTDVIFVAVETIRKASQGIRKASHIGPFHGSDGRSLNGRWLLRHHRRLLQRHVHIISSCRLNQFIGQIRHQFYI